MLMSLDRLADFALTSKDLKTLERYTFDAENFLALHKRLSRGDFPPEANRITGAIEAPGGDAIDPWPEGQLKRDYVETGRRAIAAGEVAVVILNGGMATRFGGVVKGTVPVLGTKSFLLLRLEALRQSYGPVFLLNSFATQAHTQEHLARHDESGCVSLLQHISLRLTPSGELFRNQAGEVDFYAPGHGDVFSVLSADPTFQRFRATGGRAVMVSNVDNLAATLDPTVIGYHLEHDAPITCEVARKQPGDRGGAPAVVDGRLQVVEEFRFRPEFDQDSIAVFNTNTLIFSVAVFDNEPPLHWFRADKVVEGRDVVQFERLMGQATAFVSSRYLEVPRSGPEGRFLPIKTPEDLDIHRDAIAHRLGAVTDPALA